MGGVDPGCGAGVGRDLITALHLLARVIIVGTAWTEPGHATVHGVEPRDPERVRVSLAAALTAVATEPSAVKIGMVATAATARAVADTLGSYAGAVVYDPVLRATSGGDLYEGDRESVLALARRASLLTPNLDEAGWLLERTVSSAEEAREAAQALLALGIPAVLVKGGHLEGDAGDVLCSAEGERVFASPRIPGPSPRGTGCALATAIAVGLARGKRIEGAVAEAKAWLSERIAGASLVGGEMHL